MAQFGALTLQKIVRERHSWDVRAQVVIDWYQANYGGKVQEHLDAIRPIDRVIKPQEIFTLQELQEIQKLVAPGTRGKPYLNLGCGRTHFPSAPPAGHEAVDKDFYSYPLFVNIDKVEGVGADLTFDIFQYPWPLEANSYDGAGLFHILEHIPHEIKIARWASVEALHNKEFDSQNVRKLDSLQDGWFAFFSELYRVLTPNSIVHIVSPYGFSDGGITDQSHTRYLTMNTFTHSMTPDISDGSTFKYNNGGINFVIEGRPQYRVTPYGEALKKFYTAHDFDVDFDFLIGTHLNVCYDFYVKLKVVK